LDLLVFLGIDQSCQLDKCELFLRKALENPKENLATAGAYLAVPMKNLANYSLAGSDTTFGWSLSVKPTFAAPPGDPSSTKNSVLTFEKSFHCDGTSSS